MSAKTDPRFPEYCPQCGRLGDLYPVQYGDEKTRAKFCPDCEIWYDFRGHPGVVVSVTGEQSDEGDNEQT